MSPLTVVVAPDSFKGSADAATVARALASGWRSVRPSDEVVELPLADGGEGTVDAFLAAVPGAVRHDDEVPGPTGAPVRASWAMLPDATAVVELAAASGLPLLAAPAPYDAHTRGTGRLVALALDAGARRVLVGLGGSASTDGGHGLLRELGLRVLDSVGELVVDGAHGLSAAVRTDPTDLRALPVDGVDVLTDVTSPLLGPSGAAAVFGPQKGAGPDDVLALEDALRRWADLLGGDPDEPGAGAAGGTGYGLSRWGARLVPGAPAVAAAVGLEQALSRADLVVTGEGRYDAQTSAGKTVSHVVAAARSAGVPVALVAGVVDPGADGSAFVDVVSTSELAGGAVDSVRRPGTWRARAGAVLADGVEVRA